MPKKEMQNIDVVSSKSLKKRQRTKRKKGREKHKTTEDAFLTSRVRDRDTGRIYTSEGTQKSKTKTSPVNKKERMKTKEVFKVRDKDGKLLATNVNKTKSRYGRWGKGRSKMSSKARVTRAGKKQGY